MLTATNVTRGTILGGEIEVAGTLWARFMGLMGRRMMPAGHGLWLPGSNGIHMFFMRLRIDAVFLGPAHVDGTRRVRSVHRALRPWTGIVPFVRGADGVLELPPGTIDASATEAEDAIRLA